MTPRPLPLMYRFPRDSNLRYLPMVYFLPQELIAKCPTLRTLPRSLREIIQADADKHLATIQSDAFLNEIMDAVAALAFPHFGFGGWKEHYTGYCPVWRLSYSLPLWAKLLESETGLGVQALFQIAPSENIPFFDSGFIKETMRRIVKRAITEEGWQPILDAVKEIPCDEDFEKWDTNVRKDFLRKWYHTRSKRVQTVSLEACMEDDGHGIHEIVADFADIAESVSAEDFCQRFKNRLSQKDMEILELRVEGYTHEEIADKLGYKTHSGVIKRMQEITKAFIKYEEEQS